MPTTVKIVALLTIEGELRLSECEDSLISGADTMAANAMVFPVSPVERTAGLAWPVARRVQSSAGMAATRATNRDKSAEERMLARAPEMELIREAQAGSRAAFDALVRQYDQQVLRLALHLTGSEHDAEDIYQEAFLKAYRYLGNFRFECSFYTWIYRIVTNLCLDQMRRRKTRREGNLTAELIRHATWTATAPELIERIAAIEAAGFSQIVFSILPGQEHAVEDWGRIRRAFA